MGNIPAVSVIIPMFNAEKYIADALDSLLAQTFQDYEVILVNDCSTDKSRQIVETYLEEFDGRLKLYDNEQNSKVGVTRNKGLNLSQGEYVFFMDSDDWLTPTALEEMYTLAEDHKADVVYCEKFFKADDAGKNIELKITQGAKNVDEPTLESESLAERVEYIFKKNFWGVPWNKFVRRALLVENEISFPNLYPCQDHIWTFGLFFFAKRFLRVPNAVYIWRKSSNSIIRENRTRQQKFVLWLNAAILGVKFLDDMMDRSEFLRQNVQYRYAVLEKLTAHMFELSFKHSLQIPQPSIYEAIKNEFGDKLGDFDVLVSVLCAIINKYQKIIVKSNERIAELEQKNK